MRKQLQNIDFASTKVSIFVIMKLVLDITTDEQKENIIQLAQQLNISVEVLDITEEEDDQAMVRAIHKHATGDVLSNEENAEFLAYLAK